MQGVEGEDRAGCLAKRIELEKGCNSILAWREDLAMFPALCTGPVPALLVIGFWHIADD